MKPTVEGFDPFHSPQLSPAEGLESDAMLFTAPPIESLELLKELGDIAAASIPAEEEPIIVPIAPIAPPAVAEPAPPVSGPPPAPTSDDRLLEALLEYHRLRGPKLGARTAPRPSAGTDFTRTDASAEPGGRFSSIEIPVLEDFVPKTSPNGIRASRPVQTILKPKSRR
jgi:hypothetical protein